MYSELGQGVFGTVGLGYDYSDFSVRLAEADLPKLVDVLTGIPLRRIKAMRKVVMHVRDYFVYKDMYNPSKQNREELLSRGRPNQDGFLIIALGLEARARALGRITGKRRMWRSRNRLLLRAAEVSAPLSRWKMS
eukprot:1979150-Pleurochrysis_carterae.AAC.2